MSSASASASSSGSGHEQSPSPRRIVVAHRLPLRAVPNPDATYGYDFSIDPDALTFQLSRGLPNPVVFVGALPPDAAASITDSDELSAELSARFSCHPVFLPANLPAAFDECFCKHYTSPVLRNLHPYTEQIYGAFVTANKRFANRILEVLNPAQDLIFVEHYHLWALPTMLRHNFPRARVGLYPGPAFSLTELFRAMPVREHDNILRSLLNADVVGFHNSEHVRQFLSSCSSHLRIQHQTIDGDIIIPFNGRSVVVKTLSLGVDMEHQDVEFLAWSLDQDLQTACRHHQDIFILTIGGLAMSIRVAALGPELQKVVPDGINPAYQQSSNRLLVLDYDGIPHELLKSPPGHELIRTINDLCLDPKNTVFVVSGRGKDELALCFSACERLGISAEHGYFTRWSKHSTWQSCRLEVDFHWMNIALPVMEYYTMLTEGSSIEMREASLVWHYEEADPEFGSRQAQKLLSHIQSVLHNEQVYVKVGHKVVEIYTQVLGKGVAVGNIISAMDKDGKFPDLIIFIGNDWFTEDISEAATTSMTKCETVEMPQYRVMKLVSENLQRLRSIIEDGENAYTVGVKFGHLAGSMIALHRQLTGSEEYISDLIPCFESFSGVVGDGPVGELVQKSTVLLKFVSDMIRKTNIGLEYGARALSSAGLRLQGRHPNAQTGGTETDTISPGDKITVRSLEEAEAIIDAWGVTGQLFEADVPDDMGREEAYSIYYQFVATGNHDMIRNARVLSNKIQDIDEPEYHMA